MSQNTEFVHRWWGGFNSDGLPPLDLCHERVEIRIQPEFPFTGVYLGEEGVRKWASEVFDVFESHRLEIEEIVEADSETVVMAVRSVGRTKHEDFEVDFPWAALWVIRENQLVYAQGYLTMAEARKAAGLSE